MWIVFPAIGAIAGAAVLFGVTSLVGPKYESSATLVYAPSSQDSSVPVVTQDVAFASVTSDTVLGPVADSAGMSVAELRKRLTTTEPLLGGGVVRGATVEVSVSAPTGPKAAALANGIASGAVARAKELGSTELTTRNSALEAAIDTLSKEATAIAADDPTRAPLFGQIASLEDQQVQLHVLLGAYMGPLAVTQEAPAPDGPASLVGTRAAVVGFGLGLALGVLLLLVGRPGSPRGTVE